MNTSLKPTAFVFAIALLGATAQTVAHAEEAAPNADKRAVNLAVQRDAKGNQSAAAAGSLTVGSNAWVQAGVGQSRSRDDVAGTTSKPNQVSIGGGVAGKQWQAGVNASQRRDGSALRQTDLAASVDFKPVDGVSVGLDATKRNARARGTVAASNGGAPTAVEQRLKGHGLGVHGAVAVTPRVTVYGATMRNKYSSTTTATQAGGQGGLLGNVPLLNANRVSVVNRDEAALDRSHQLGATYRVSDHVTLNGELSQDRLHDGGSLRSVQLKAAIAAGNSGWTITPGVGRSRGPNGEGVNYGSVGASFAW
ncbi:MAG TPA: hypothetical protein VIN58_19140 [Roseateles sp.]